MATKAERRAARMIASGTDNAVLNGNVEDNKALEEEVDHETGLNHSELSASEETTVVVPLVIEGGLEGTSLDPTITEVVEEVKVEATRERIPLSPEQLKEVIAVFQSVAAEPPAAAIVVPRCETCGQVIVSAETTAAPVAEGKKSNIRWFYSVLVNGNKVGPSNDWDSVVTVGQQLISAGIPSATISLKLDGTVDPKKVWKVPTPRPIRLPLLQEMGHRLIAEYQLTIPNGVPTAPITAVSEAVIPQPAVGGTRVDVSTGEALGEVESEKKEAFANLS